MVNIDSYTEEKSCIYKDEEYLVRDNGAVLRKPRLGKRARKLDNKWTFGKLNKEKGYFEIEPVPVHRIVATAFHGEPATKEHVVYHIDADKQNNRPINLRWITKLEQAVLNEGTRNKFEYRTGVSIYDFLENPSKYRNAIADRNFNWMQRVTEEEARSCLNNVVEMIGQTTRSVGEINSGLAERIINSTMPTKDNNIIKSLDLDSSYGDKEEKSNFNPSIVINKQEKWRTPTDFVCCPNIAESEVTEAEAIRLYCRNLSEGAVFSRNKYGESKVIKHSCINEKTIFVITSIPSGIKPWGLTQITFENGRYMHTGQGMFWEEAGAERSFALAQGIEWHGEDSIDNYC